MTGEKRTERMISIFTATPSLNCLQDVVDQRAASDVVDLAAHRRQRSEQIGRETPSSSLTARRL
jgi:hypothetical protein